VQRVVGRRDQNFVASIQERVHAHGDKFARAVAEVDVVHGDPGDALLLGVVNDCLARGEQPLAVGIARGHLAGQIADHVLHDLVRRHQAERRHIPDVQLDDLVALVLHLPGLVEHGAANVVTDVSELG
jgi:hypothetical protein